MAFQNQGLCLSLNPLSHTGVNASQPSNFYTKARDPVTNDSKNFLLGSWWLNTSNYNLWYLAALSGHIATWILIGAANGTILFLQGNTGGPVAPAPGTGLVNVVGDGTTITIAGNPATHTLTASLSTTGIVIGINGDTGGTIFPVAGVINFRGGATGLSFNGAGNTETLSFAGITANNGNVNLSTDALASTIHIGTGAAQKLVVLGSATGASATGIQYGLGGFEVSSGSGPVIQATPAGVLTFPLQPMFQADLSANALNQTGANTLVTVVCDQIEYSQGSGYDGTTGIFTAPETGVYTFSATISVTGITAAMTSGILAFYIRGATWRMLWNNPYAAIGTGTRWLNSASIAAVYMQAGDTAYVAINVQGGAGNTCTIEGGPSTQLTTFCGAKIA